MNRRLPVYVATMTDLHDYNDDSTSVKSVDNAVVPNSQTIVVWGPSKLLYAWWKGVVSKLRNLWSHPALQLTTERSKFSQCGGGELDGVAHRRRSDYNPSSFLIFDQGIVGSFRRFRACSRSIRSSICSNNSISSMGTTAAMGFLRRCTITRSRPYAARLMMSANSLRAVLEVIFRPIKVPNAGFVQIVPQWLSQ